jgi:hypothetical protein
MPKNPQRLASDLSRDDEAKDRYVELIYEGWKHWRAAEELGATSNQFSKLWRSPRSQWYDAHFAEQVSLALRSEEHRRNSQDMLRERLDRKADSDGRLLEKQAYLELPEWEPLRHQNFQHNVRIEALAAIVPTASTQELERLRELLVEAQQSRTELHALPPAESAESA